MFLIVQRSGFGANFLNISLKERAELVGLYFVEQERLLEKNHSNIMTELQIAQYLIKNRYANVSIFFFQIWRQNSVINLFVCTGLKSFRALAFCKLNK